MIMVSAEIARTRMERWLIETASPLDIRTTGEQNTNAAVVYMAGRSCQGPRLVDIRSVKKDQPSASKSNLSLMVLHHLLNQKSAHSTKLIPDHLVTSETTYDLTTSASA